MARGFKTNYQSGVKRKFRLKKIVVLPILGIILLIAIGFLGYKIFTENKLSKFDITHQNLNCVAPPEVSQFLNSLNMNYFYYKSTDVEYELRRKFFCIGKIEQEISYPDRLKLNITGREGKYVVKTINTDVETNPQIVLTLEQMNATQSTTQAFPPKVLTQILDTYENASESAMFLVDAEGIAFEKAFPGAGYPEISLFGRELRVGQKIPDDLISKVTEVKERLEKMDIVTDNLIVVGNRLIVDSEPRVTFGLNREISRQSASLQLILRQAKMNLDPEKPDSRSVESVDLRFDRPVVIYSK